MLFFFFKQKTAYEVRISDCSSDVCSSDLLWRLRHPRVRTMRVPLMGVLKKLQATRLASQLAFMMIEYIRRDAVVDYGARRGEIGWILEDNQGMRSIAEAIDSKINKIYRIYERAL